MTASKYKNTELGPIPEDWGVEYLGQLCTRIGDGIHSTPNYSLNGEYCFVNGNNLVNGKIHINSDTKRVNNDEFLLHKRELTKKTILLSINGTIGNLAIYNNEKIILGKSAAYLNINDKTYLKFLYFSLQSTITKNFIENALTGTTIRNLGLNSIRSLPIPLPPSLTEQKAIATALSDTDALISSLGQLIAKKRAIKQGAMQELLKPKDGWEVKEIKDIARITTGNKNTQDKIADGIYPFFVRSQIIERINSYSFDGEAVLTAGDGVGVGKVIHYINGKFDCHQRVYIISDFSKEIKGYYFFLYFKNNFLNRISQMTAKSSVDSVRMDTIANMIIPFPQNINEQNKIATILSDMDEEIATVERKLDKYKQIKQGMMQQLLTGKIRLV